jgi:hypothetical protein
MVAGMSFELFCRALMFMALLAYRNLDAAVPTTYKVSKRGWKTNKGICAL